ncbi:MAG: RNA polymerase sigma factor [Saonia sp.]
MKIISLYNNEKTLIKKATGANREAQRAIYNRYAPKMLSVCRQYIKDLQFAEDVMIKGFVKVFNHIGSFKHQGSFEGWIRRIMIREAISHLRKNQFVIFDDELFDKNPSQHISFEDELDVQHIQRLIDGLPEGYKMVFVLYAIEGYKHNEIAEMLHISESTSKSQLFKARRALQEKLRLIEFSGRAQ